MLSRTTEADLAKQVGEEPAAVTMAHLHAHPEAVVQNRALSFDVARQKLAQSLQSFEKGEHWAVLPILRYRPIWTALNPLSRRLLPETPALMGRIETAMGKYRSLLTSKAARARTARPVE